MKKAVVVILTLAMALTLFAACNSGNDNGSQPPSSEPPSSQPPSSQPPSSQPPTSPSQGATVE
ncbi:MAG: hypothetical protein LBH28_00210, partial [Oscillospiraceae bacterium]|nr:hypothetical protein [Oscillospiraceae bacterium]